MNPRSLKPLPTDDPERIRSALEGMRERDRRVLELRYGLEGGQPRSRAEIAEMLGISRERVRQLESRALEALSGRPAGGRRGSAPSPASSASAAPSRRTFLRSWTFLLLWLRPAHVYELKSRLREIGLPAAGYRMLQALEREGYLRSSWAPGRGAGPSRRVYDLTPSGLQQLHNDVPSFRKLAETLQRFLGENEFSEPEEVPAAAPSHGGGPAAG